jgi:hypothetical protein
MTAPVPECDNGENLRKRGKLEWLASLTSLDSGD